MKYIALLLLGAVAARQPESTSLAQISSNARTEAFGSESDSESDDDDDESSPHALNFLNSL